jgi:DNA (cytosine-5)-methyltransferase 1
VFIIGHSRRFPRREVFPITGTNGQAGIEVVADLNRHKYETLNRVYGVDGIAPTISTMQGGDRQPVVAVPVPAQDRHGVLVGNGRVRIRRLTPLETFRLQGFPDEHFHNARAAGVSDSQLYKQAGNAVTVTVVYEIAKRLG